MGQQILYLLARIGIFAYLDDGYKSNKATTPCYKITINAGEDIKRFQSHIVLCGKKGKKLESITPSLRGSYFTNKLGRATTESIFEVVRENYTTSRIRVQKHGERRLTIGSLKKIFQYFEKEKNGALESYRWLVSDGIVWDGVESIDPLGEEKVFDRAVPQTNNYVVNGIIVHNSGNLEQDADLVLLLHRPELYKADDYPGVVEIGIAKQRNGIAGVTIQLQYDKHTTRFKNLYNQQDEPPPY